jgi:hypothetical protein
MRGEPSLRHGELIDFRIGRLKQLRDIGQTGTVHRIALGMISERASIKLPMSIHPRDQQVVES